LSEENAAKVLSRRDLSARLEEESCTPRGFQQYKKGKQMSCEEENVKEVAVFEVADVDNSNSFIN